MNLIEADQVMAKKEPSPLSEFIKPLKRCIEIAFLKQEGRPIRLTDCCELPNAPIT